LFEKINKNMNNAENLIKSYMEKIKKLTNFKENKCEVEAELLSVLDEIIKNKP
jgi:hypothetical protein